MRGLVKAIKFINEKLLLRFQSWIMVINMQILLILILITIISRNVLHMEIIRGTEEILALLTSWMYFMGGSLASYEDSHVSADLVSAIIKSELGRGIHKLYICIITIGTCLIAGKWSFDWLVWTDKFNMSSSVYNYPYVLLYCPVFICLVMSAVYFTGHGVKAVKTIKSELKKRRAPALESGEQEEGV